MTRTPRARTQGLSHCILRNLKALAGMLRHSWESDKKEMLKIVRRSNNRAGTGACRHRKKRWEAAGAIRCRRTKGPLDWRYRKTRGGCRPSRSTFPRIKWAQDHRNKALYVPGDQVNERFALDSVAANLYDRSLLLTRMSTLMRRVRNADL